MGGGEMTQKNLFINVKEDGIPALAYGNIRDGHTPINGYKRNLLIPFTEKIKMSEEDFKRLTYYLKNNCGKLALSFYGMSAEQTLLLTLEFYLGNDLNKFVEIEEPKHAYKIKKELESKQIVWDTETPFLLIRHGKAYYSDSPCDYSRFEFGQLPKAIQDLFDEVE